MWSARRAGVPLVNGYSGGESTLYRRLRDVQASPPNRATQHAAYALLNRYGVTTIIADDPCRRSSTSPRCSRSLPECSGFPDTTARLRVDRFEMGRGEGLIPRIGVVVPRAQRTRIVGLVPSMPAPRRKCHWGRATPADLAARAIAISGWRSCGALVERTTARRADHWRDPRWHSFRLPETAADGADWIDLELRGPRPIRLPGSRDPRALGICVFEIRLQ